MTHRRPSLLVTLSVLVQVACWLPGCKSRCASGFERRGDRCFASTHDGGDAFDASLDGSDETLEAGTRTRTESSGLSKADGGAETSRMNSSVTGRRNARPVMTDASMPDAAAATDAAPEENMDAGSDAAMPGTDGAAGGAAGNAGEAGGGAPAPTCEASPETCDGTDNDCDGKLDEDPSDCASPNVCSEGRCAQCEDGNMEMCEGPSVGACSPGVRRCEAGTWSSCTGVTTSSVEVCDNVDNDCDGEVDDSPSDCASPKVCSAGRCRDCQDGATEACTGNTMGVCNPGVRRCNSGTWSSCTGVTTSSVEVCDNVDNDCDGDIDDNPSDCASPKICSAGRCRDCQDGATEACTGNTMGICNPGTRRCNGGTWSGCTGVVNPGTETCDNLDNDCDGDIDDSPSDCRSPNRCNAGRCNECSGTQSEPCEGNNTGECRSGTRTCSGGQWGTCSGQRGPGDESCDGRDNDCDDRVDEDASACPANTVCQRGECVMKCGDGEVQEDEECDWSVEGWAGLCDSMTCTRNYYGNCDTVGGACMQNGVCGEFLNAGGMQIRQCGLSCQADSQCPGLPGNEEAECNFAACVLLCDDGNCPNRMRCSRAIQIYNPLDGSYRHTKDICVEE